MLTARVFRKSLVTMSETARRIRSRMLLRSGMEIYDRIKSLQRTQTREKKVRTSSELRLAPIRHVVSS